MKVKNRTKILVGILLVAVAALVAGIFGGLFSGRDALDGITDIDTLRVKLKEKVSSGELTEVQAQFRLAEAKAVASVGQMSTPRCGRYKTFQRVAAVNAV